MAISVVQNKAENAGEYTNSHAISFASNVAAGNLIVVCISSQGGDVTGISDNQSNSYTLVENGSQGGILCGRLYYAKNTNSGATTITVTYGDYYDSIISIFEISGCDTTAPLDVSAENVETEYLVVHPTGTTGTTAQNDEIAIGMYTGDNNCLTYTVGESFTGLIDTNGSDLWSSLVTAYKILSATGAQTATFDSSVGDIYMQGYGAIATFKEAGGATYNKAFIETANLTDTFSREATFNKSVTDTSTLTDTISVQLIGVLNVSETITLTDIVTIIGINVIPLQITDSLEITDSLNKEGIFNKHISETIDLTDVFSREVIANRLFTEEINLTDIPSVKGILNRLIPEILELSDSVYAKATINKYLNVSEIITLTDSFVRQAIFNINPTELISITDAINRQIILNRLFSETISLTDSVYASATVNKYLALLETITLTDNLNMQGRFNLINVEVINPYDSINVYRVPRIFNVDLADSITFSDVINLYRSTDRNININELITLTEFIRTKSGKRPHERMRMMHHGRYKDSKMGRMTSTDQRLIKIV